MKPGRMTLPGRETMLAAGESGGNSAVGPTQVMVSFSMTTAPSATMPASASWEPTLRSVPGGQTPTSWARSRSTRVILPCLVGGLLGNLQSALENDARKRAEDGAQAK